MFRPKQFHKFIYNKNQMSTSIRQIYSVVNHLDTYGIEGYHVDNKYYDPAKLKEQKVLETSKDKIQGHKPTNVGKKSCFIDQIQKKQAKLPGPCSYEPKQINQKAKTQSLAVPSRRKTIFDEMQHVSKKHNFPGAGTYGKVTCQADKSKLRSNISKAQNSNYLDSSMRDSLQSPGVGQYNAYHGQVDHRASKWVDQRQGKKAASLSLKLPPVGTYHPLPLQYQLFDNSLGTDKKRYKSYFNKQERFKKSRDKPLPFYNILSEWGLKEKGKKNDILSRISSPNSNRSVYR